MAMDPKDFDDAGPHPWIVLGFCCGAIVVGAIMALVIKAVFYWNY